MENQKLSFIKRVKAFAKRNSYALVVVGCASVLTIALLVTAVMSAKLTNQETYETVIPSTSTNTQTEVQKPTPNVPVDKPLDGVEPDIPVSSMPIVFLYPVDEYSLGHIYSDEKLVKNETLNEWTTHLGIDFIVGDGAEVKASFAGTIESVTYDSLTGTTIIIDHGDGLKTIYSSLESDVMVTVGDVVDAGDVIGTASVCAGEQKLGNHLHFEVMKDGKLVDPMNYLGEK